MKQARREAESGSLAEWLDRRSGAPLLTSTLPRALRRIEPRAL